MSTSRALAAVLATAALAAPTAAQARPAELGVPAAQAQTPQQPKQNLSSPDARDAANGYRPQLNHKPPANPTVYVQPNELAPVAEQSAATSGSTDQQPISPAPAANISDSGNGIDWTTIALGIAGSLLAVSGIAALTNRRNRRRALRATE